MKPGSQLQTMKLQKETTYNLGEFTSTETGHAKHKDGAIATFDDKPVYAFGHAPDKALPGQAFFKKDGELGFYTANGLKKGAALGSVRESRKVNYTLPLRVFAANANPFTPMPEGADDDTKHTIRVENASKFIGMLFGEVTLDIPGREAGTEEKDWDDDNDEFVSFAQKSGVKKSDMKGLMKLRAAHPMKTVEVPAIPPSKTSMRALLKAVGPNGKVELSPAQVGSIRQALMEKVSDCVRLVSDAAEDNE